MLCRLCWIPRSARTLAAFALARPFATLVTSASDTPARATKSSMGMAWSAGTYFVVPVLVVERVNPLEAMKRSVAVLKKSWGEALAANFGIGMIVTLMSIVAMVPAVLGIFGGSTLTMAVGIGVTVVLLIVISLVSSAVNTIVVGALYMYAAQGRVPDQFDESALSNAFGHR